MAGWIVTTWRRGSAQQAGEVALEAGERQPRIEHVVGRNRRSEVIDRLVPNVVDHRRSFGFRGDGDRDHPDVLTMDAGHLDQGLVVVVRHHLELAVGQALPAFGALKPARLTAKDIEHVHAMSLPLISERQTTQSGFAPGRLRSKADSPRTP